MILLLLALAAFDVEVNSPDPGALECRVWTMPEVSIGRPLEGELAGECWIHEAVCTQTGIYAKFHINPRGASILGVCIRQDLEGTWTDCVDIFTEADGGGGGPDPPHRREEAAGLSSPARGLSPGGQP
jgi:hypothetical protein